MARGDFAIVGDKHIGSGQYGTVFLAERLSDGLRVALKIVLRSSEGGPEKIAAERHGAMLQQRFAELHGMVPGVYDFGEDGQDFYIAMELANGTSLEELLRRAGEPLGRPTGPLPVREAVDHAMWLCDFLDKAHGFSTTVEGKPYRLLHNDLKPAHVMISASGERKVLDFGISKALEEARELATDIGRTIAYAAPERLQSEHVNVHADFWSLGVMLYEMVSGHRPYPELDGHRFRRQLERAIITNARRAPLPSNCPPHLAAIINRLLAFQPEQRYQSAGEIKADLERFLRDETPEATVLYDTPATTPVTRSTSHPALDLPPLTAVSTDPLPLADVTAPVSGVAVADPVSANPAAVATAPAVVRRSSLHRIVWTLMSLAFVVVIATEGVACIFAERLRDDLPTLDERTVTARKASYAAVDRWGLFDFGLRARVNAVLVDRLRGVGDRVIADYRRESPLMGPREWQQALEAFAWARQLSHRDPRIRARQLLAEAHVRRFAALKASGSAATLAAEAALAKFREAAALDEASFDPFLGMAVIQVYSLADVDGAITSIEEAVKRGYVSTRRETAMLGDAHMRRGTSSRTRAQVLTGEQRVRELVKARADFEQCLALFEPIIEFGRAAQNFEICRQHIRWIDRQLQHVAAW